MATTDRRTLADDRGVVAIVGLAMAVFLTALVYYEMGIGDAITFKEQLQDASDASGFAAAVYHAKGMNMIVLLNLIMAAVLAIIVILRVLQLLFGIVSALIPAICWIPGLEWLCPFESAAVEGEEWASTTAETMDPIVKTALIGLNDVATAIAVGMPWVALIKSGTVGTQYYPQVTSDKGGGTIMLSMSLIPDMSWIPPVSGASSKASSAIMNGVGLGSEGGEGTSSQIEGKRWGLPVQEGEFDYLCDQAAQALPDLIEWAINAAFHGPNAQPPKWLSWLNNTIGGIIGSWPQFFCDSDSMTSSQIDSMVQSQAQTACNNNQKQWNQCVQQLELYGFSAPQLPPIPAGGGPLPPTGTNSTNADSTGACKGIGTQVKASPAFDMKGCMSEETETIDNEASAASKDWGATKESTLPKAIYTYAANGNDYMAVWSFAWGTFSNNEESGVSLAEWGNGGSAPSGTSPTSGGGLAPPKPTHPTMLTKAEFFYAVENPCTADSGKQDFGTKGSATLCSTPLDMPYWGDYQADTMWNPRWKARLRRVAPPMIPIGQMASSGFSSLLGTALSKGLGMLPSVPVPSTPSGKSNLGSPDSDGAGAGEVVEFITGWLQIGGGMADGAVAGQIEKAAGYLH